MINDDVTTGFWYCFPTLEVQMRNKTEVQNTSKQEEITLLMSALM